MPGEGYRILLDCRRRSKALRARSFTFDQIADVLALDYDASPLRLYRYAHGRTASDVVAAHNDLDPAGAASLREARLYDYEAWPITGRRVPARIIAIFARLYQTTARCLLSDEVYASYNTRDRDPLDRADHRHLDPHQHRHPRSPTIYNEAFPARESTAYGEAPPRESTPRLAAYDEPLSTWGLVTTAPLRDSMEPQPVPARVLPLNPAHYTELLRALRAEEADVKRRELLFELALLLGGTPALSLLRHLTPPEHERLAFTARQQMPIDSRTIDLLERLTSRLWEADESFGPQQVLPVAEAKRALINDLLHQSSLSPVLRNRLLRLYWSLSHMSGWCHYDLLDFPNATRRYTEGLAAAHELQAPALLAHLHGLLADMALHQRKPTVAMDHSFAAEGWAKKSHNRLQQAATFNVVARVLSGASHDDAGLRVLDRAIALASAKPNDADFRHLFWCNPDHIDRHIVFCLVELNRPDQAIAEADRIMAKMDPGWNRERGILQLEYATTLIKKREIPAAAAMIGETAQIVTSHSSTRLANSVRQARRRLRPWEDNKYVRDLDQRLREFSIVH
ncbi:hypothetical protein SAMN05216276_1004134 [Streptosporangium subroseum]|uniref:HTH cro/C1-type domain-containing protein n=1 Tax=Streptosporangium subroseum TaxID=106412 RepID=A0A239BTP5_9ACTN|nr:hypothetical protein [Streptosporangium subroseum]SNS11405.1 hypothetical protein SAMN05216276_1004134 [Streptosporangium subroseum]